MQWPELELARAKAHGLVCKPIEDTPQSLAWETVRNRLCQVFNPVATKMHSTTWIYSRPQATNETLQEYIWRFTDLVQATSTDPTAIKCQVTIFLVIRHLYLKKSKKQVAGAKTIQTLRHTLTLAQEAEIKFKKKMKAKMMMTFSYTDRFHSSIRVSLWLS